MYHNEREVGSSILSYISSPSNTSSLQRADIHFTSKLASNTSYDAARKSIKRSVKESGLGYIDLFLLHSPYGGKTKRLECWKAVEDAIEDGEVKSGGVSNFGVKHVSGIAHSSSPLNHTLLVILLRLLLGAAAGAARFESSSTPNRQPGRSSPFQYSNGHHLLLPRARHCCGSIRTLGSSTPNEGPNHHIAIEKVLVYASSAHDPMELAA